MALVKRKKTVRSAVLDVVIAPFVFIFVMAWFGRIYFVVALIALLFCMWMDPQPVETLIPSSQSVYIFLGVLACIAIAAIPLAILDYFSTGDVVWQPTPGCLTAAQTYVENMMSGDVKALHSAFAPELQLNLTEYKLEEMVSEFRVSVCILDMKELNIPEDTVHDYLPEIDCVVRVDLQLSNDADSLILCMNSQRSFQIVSLLLPQFEMS